MLLFWYPHRVSAVLGNVTLPREMRASQPLEPWQRRMTLKTPNVFPRGWFSQCAPKTTPDMCNASYDNSIPAHTSFLSATRGPFLNAKTHKKRPKMDHCYACIYIYIYIYICCEVIMWAKFGHFRCYYLGQVGVIIWAKLFLAYKNSGFKRFLHTQLSFCVFFLCPIIWQLSKNSLFQKRVQKLGFSIFCVLSLKFENYLF